MVAVTSKTAAGFTISASAAFTGDVMWSVALPTLYGWATFADADSADVTFVAPFDNDLYWLNVGTNDITDGFGPVTVGITNKTATGFTITTSAPFTGQIGWSAAP